MSLEGQGEGSEKGRGREGQQGWEWLGTLGKKGCLGRRLKRR